MQFAALIAEETRDGAELVEYALKVLRPRNKTTHREEKLEKYKSNHKSRQSARLALAGDSSNVCVHIAHGAHLAGNRFWNLHPQCLLKGDDKVDGIQRVEAEILAHSRLGMDSRRLELELIYQSLIDNLDRPVGGERLRHGTVHRYQAHRICVNPTPRRLGSRCG
jgi:hypothetical protein